MQMCLALPCRIVTRLRAGRALVEGPGGRREIDVSAVDAPAPGTFVLVAYGAAIREIDLDEAAELLELLSDLVPTGGQGES